MTACMPADCTLSAPLPAMEAYGLAVPEIMPLETLHNSLTLKQFDQFLSNVISIGSGSPLRSFSQFAPSTRVSLSKYSSV